MICQYIDCDAYEYDAWGNVTVKDGYGIINDGNGML